MTITLAEMTGGLALEQDLVFPSQPEDPAMRESISVWLFEENGAFAFPRCGIEAEASSWDDRRVQFNLAFADGRVLNGAGRGPAHSPIDANGQPTILGAGPIAFRCVEPFRRWTMTWDGPASDGHVAEQIARTYGSRRSTAVKLTVDMVMETPAWVQQVSTDTANMTELEAQNAAAMGMGYRFEHLFRATGTLEIDGMARPFNGTGIRIHRQSIRALDGFYGHCWLSALFPDGSAFACLAYPSRDGSDGELSYNEAMLYKDGRMIPARIVKAPFLRRIVPSGDEMVLELESELGRTIIEGTTALATFRVGNPDIGGLNLQQSAALFRWDGQSAYGMVERSTHESLTVIG